MGVESLRLLKWIAVFQNPDSFHYDHFMPQIRPVIAARVFARHRALFNMGCIPISPLAGLRLGFPGIGVSVPRPVVRQICLQSTVDGFTFGRAWFPRQTMTVGSTTALVSISKWVVVPVTSLHKGPRHQMCISFWSLDDGSELANRKDGLSQRRLFQR